MTPWRIALGYIAFSVLALALFAMPLWYGWRANIGTFRTYVPEEMQVLTDLFHREGAAAVTEAVRSHSRLPRDEVVLFAGPGKEVLAGTLRAWPPEVPDAPGTYGLMIGVGADSSMRVVASHVTLPGDYHLLMGRESVRFESLVERFWYGMVAALAIVLALGGALAWLLARRTSAVRHSEERYARAMQATKDGIWEWNPATDEIFMSDRARELWAVPDGVAVRTRADLKRLGGFHPEDLQRTEDEIAASRVAGVHGLDIEYRVIGSAGEVRWVRSQGRLFPGAEGRPGVVTGSLTDVTERKLADLALAESEARFRSLTELSSDFFWETDAEHRYTAIELGWAYAGVRNNETKLGLARWEIPYASPDEAAWAAHRATIAARERFVDFGFSRIEADEERFYEHSGEPRYDAQGNFLGYRGVGRDVTARKLAEEALRESQERYALAVAGSDDGVWDCDFAARRIFVSARARELVGMPPGPEMVPMDEWFAMLPLHPEDVPRRIAAMQAHLAGETPAYDGEFRLRQPDGAYRWRRLHGLCLRDADGNPHRMAGSISDVDARRRAEEALKLSEERYALALEASEEGHFDVDLETGEIFASARLNEIYGFPRHAKTANRVEYLNQVPFHPDDRHLLADIASSDWEDPARVTRLERYSLRIVPRPGETRWIQTHAMVTRDAQGRARRRVGVIADITERKLAEEARRLSEERYALAMEVAEEGHFDWNVQTDEIFASAHLKKLLGLPADAEYRTRSEMSARVRYYPGDRERLDETTGRVLGGPALQDEFEYRILRGEETRWLRRRWKIFRDAAGAAVRVIGVVTDITERRRAVETLRESEARFRRMTELSADTYWEQDEKFRYTRTGSGTDIAGYATDVNQGRTRWELCGEATPLSSSWQQHQAVLEAHQPFRDFEYRRLQPDGTIGYYSASGAPMFDAEGRFQGYQGVACDITERKRVEEALRQSEERYALAVAGSNEGIFDWDLVSDRVYVSYRAQELFGLPRGELWRPRRDWRHIVTFHPDDAPRLHDRIKAHIEGGTPTYDEEFRIVLPGGGVRWFRQRGIALRDASGKAYRVVGSIGDVTEQHKAEEELRSLERRLRLAQRLEAMGTLAGGIAHDFNNILGAILGYGEMALRDARKGSRLARDLDSIIVAGERGRALVDRVLAFSRSAVGERVPVHVEKVVREALDLLSAKLPPDVTLHAKLHAGRAAMLGDATQVHQVLMNLATNAIHAMPAGGTLRVSLSAVHLAEPRTPTLGIMPAGDYLILQVADSGTGIAPEILERIFDPFFTTKDVGTGTGLGLSLVHGIVAELDGAIDVASTPGAGSTFTVFLPRSGDALDSSQKEAPELPRGDGQRVLVVDDEEPLVRLATRTLEELGYAPVGFTSSAAALAAFRADPQRFDAVITDERMPGMSGAVLIREVRGIRDRIPVVLMTGFVGGTVASAAREAGAEEVLKKPLSARDLAASLARVLHP